MSQSAFVSKNEKTIKIDGINEVITIRPLSASEQTESRDSRINPPSLKPIYSRSNEKAAERGIVRVGEVVKPQNERNWRWADILNADVLNKIGAEVWKITS